MKRMIIDCVQCGSEFELSPAEVDHYISKGFDLPKRCSDCRKKKSRGENDDAFRSQREKKKHYRLKYDDR